MRLHDKQARTRALTSRNSTRPISPSSLMQSYAEPDCRNNCARHISSLLNPDPILSPLYQPPCWSSPPSAFTPNSQSWATLQKRNITFGVKVTRIAGTYVCHKTRNGLCRRVCLEKNLFSCLTVHRLCRLHHPPSTQPIFRYTAEIQ